MMRFKAMTLATLSALSLGAAMMVSGAIAASQGDAAMGSTTDTKTLDCEMNFVLDGWSAAYLTAQGHGTVKCGNGESMPVTLDAKGGGLTAGAFKINDGHAEFTHVHRITDVLGDYGMAKAHVGAAKTAQGAVMTKGNVTASLGGTGDGWDIGIGFGKFSIKRAGGA
ncbi:MAG: hypothetical protein WBW61_11055 [Rhodanobacteraceae bacterium]